MRPNDKIMHETINDQDAAESLPEPPQRSHIEVAIACRSGGWYAFPGAEAIIAEAASAAAAAITRPEDGPIELSVALVCDDEIKALNTRFRNQEKATNVLSFPNGMMLSRSEDKIFLGDVVIALETVLAEARAEGKDPRHHLAHLTVHGVLHLFGYEHDDEEEAERMEALERTILASLGIADPYGIVSGLTEPEAA